MTVHGLSSHVIGVRWRQAQASPGIRQHSPANKLPKRASTMAKSRSKPHKAPKLLVLDIVTSPQLRKFLATDGTLEYLYPLDAGLRSQAAHHQTHLIHRQPIQDQPNNRSSVYHVDTLVT